MQRFSSTAQRAGRSRTAPTSLISSRTGVVRLISMGLGAHGIKIVCGEEPPCATQADCDNRCPGCGFRCVQACDGQQCCRSPCVS